MERMERADVRAPPTETDIYLSLIGLLFDRHNGLSNIVNTGRLFCRARWSYQFISNSVPHHRAAGNPRKPADDDRAKCNWNARCIAKMEREGLDAFEPRAEAEREWIAIGLS